MTALEGTIKEFGIADILQLICQQQKTGVITVEYKAGKAEIYLSEGTIVAAHDATSTAINSLGDTLIRAKLITPQELQKALETQQNTFEYMGEILVQQGTVTRQDLEKALLVQIYETFYDILQWKEGSYKFIPKSIKIKAPVAYPLTIESLLLDTLRMIDEWTDIKRTIPSFDILFQQVPGMRPENLREDGLFVFNLADGSRTTQHIINESLLGRFSTCKILAALLQAGYISPVTARAGASQKSFKKISYQIFSATASYVVLCITIVIIFFLPTTFPENILPILNPAHLNQSSLREYRQNRTVAKIEKALEVYRIKQGSYPENLDKLMYAGFLKESDLKLQGPDQILYMTDSDTFSLKIGPAEK